MHDTISLSRSLPSLDGVRYALRHPIDRPAEVDSGGAHIHNEYEIYLNVSGNVSFLVNNRLYPVQAGDAVITRPGDVHVCITEGVGIHDHYCLWLTAPQGSPLLSVFDGERHFLRAAAGEGSLSRLFPLLEEAVGTEGCPVTAASVFLQILCALRASEDRIPSAERLPAEMQAILDYINAHFAEIESVGEVPDSFYISGATMNRWFRKYIRLSPREFLEAKKLSNARLLLRRGASVTEAALQSGYSDCSYFIAAFKKRFGETPGTAKRRTDLQ